MTQHKPTPPESRPPPPTPPPIPPPMIGYRQLPPPPGGGGAGQFFLGLIIGSVFSGVVYVPLMVINGEPPIPPAVFVSAAIVVKTLAIIWAFRVRRKALAAGLLTSVPVAILIFVVGCFYAVVQNMH